MPTEPRRNALSCASLLLVASGLAACGGAAPPAAAPADAPAPVQLDATPRDAEGSLAELDRAEAELDRAVGGKTKERAGPAVPGSPPEAAQQADASADACESACRALASMQRAAAHLCELAGDADPRCDAAKGRVARADERVRASCPACAG